jgi:hypothetical protein
VCAQAIDAAKYKSTLDCCRSILAKEGLYQCPCDTNDRTPRLRRCCGAVQECSRFGLAHGLACPVLRSGKASRCLAMIKSCDCWTSHSPTSRIVHRAVTGLACVPCCVVDNFQSQHNECELQLCAHAHGCRRVMGHNAYENTRGSGALLC